MFFALIHFAESFSYDIAFADENDLKIAKFLNVENWKYYLNSHSNRSFVNILLCVIKRGVKIEYIGFKQNRVCENHSFVNETFEILLVDVENQWIINRLSKMKNSYAKFYICSLLNLISKHDENWKRIHNFSYSKKNSVNSWISRNYEILEYIAFD